MRMRTKKIFKRSSVLSIQLFAYFVDFAAKLCNNASQHRTNEPRGPTREYGFVIQYIDTINNLTTDL